MLKNTIKLLLSLLVFVWLVAPYAATPVQAAQEAGDAYMRCDRMKAATDPGDCLIVFTTSSATFTETLFKVTLDSEFVSTTHFSTTVGNYTVTTTGIPATSTAMPGINTATNVTGNTISFPISNLTASTEYAFIITGTGMIANPAASTTILHTLFTTDATPTTNDTKSISSPIISDDQIVVTATVGPSFTFTLGSNSAALGTLSSGSVTSASGNTLTIVTNSPSGWTAWVKDSEQGLDSTNAGHTIPTTGTVNGSPSSLSAGTEGYVLDVNLTADAADGGTVTIDAEYDGGTTSAGGTLSSTYQPIASADGTANSDVLTLIPRAAISGITPAATDYTDTLTVVGAGIF